MSELITAIEVGPLLENAWNQLIATPVRVGVPLKKSRLNDIAFLSLRDKQGQPIVAQIVATQRWSDGSLKWILVEWIATKKLGLTVFLHESTRSDTANTELMVRGDADNGFIVHTGVCEFALDNESSFPLRAVKCRGQDVLGTSGVTLTASDGAHDALTVRLSSMRVERQGPVSVTLTATGTLGDTENLHLQILLSFFCGLDIMQVDCTVTNSLPAAHPGGIWELGSPASVYFSDLSLNAQLTDTPGELMASTDLMHAGEMFPTPFDLYQESSGGKNWRSSNHVNRDGEVPMRFRGWRLQAAENETTGFRASPFLRTTSAHGSVACAIEHFWQEFPKSIALSNDRLRIGLWPGQFPDKHELQGGERKTHRLWMRFDDTPMCDAVNEFAWVFAPPVGVVEPGYVSETDAVPYLVPRDESLHPTYEALVQCALEGDTSFAAKSEVIDEFGWRNFGDLYADHETIFWQQEQPLISHYNNQYDAIWAFAIHFLRSGDRRWFALMRNLSNHVVDIDVYHTRGDKSAYNGGMFWHTAHYIDAGKSSHRSLPNSEGVHGGGPSPDHCYSSGLMLVSFLTGSTQAASAVVSLGDFLIASEDGALTKYRYLDRQPTGVTSMSGTSLYHGPGRGPACTIEVLMNALQVTSDHKYLELAQTLLRRCANPQDDLAERTLENIEERWFYTMFLRSLGRYLDAKIERGELDEHYAYAVATLLHYARWMVEHEYPYLDKPEVLEFPTETWAAQDMRKSEVLYKAAMLMEGDERQRCEQQARFFYDVSLSQLEKYPSRTFARPMVLILGLGLVPNYFHVHQKRYFPQPSVTPDDWGQPIHFVPQKARVVRKLKKILVGGTLFVGVLGAGLLAVL